MDRSGVITTIAGNGIGFTGDNGPAVSALLFLPSGVAVGPAGNVYIADTNNNRIRMVSTSGIITTVAGSPIGTPGFGGDGEPATGVGARLNHPSGIALDRAGNLYVADYNNARIRKVDIAGILTTVAGNGLPKDTGDGGPATGAGLQFPMSVALDATGNLLISTGSGIRRVAASDGTIDTVAGNVPWVYSGDGQAATSVQLDRPYGLTMNSSGNLLISGRSLVWTLDPSGIIRAAAGTGVAGYSGDGGPATAAQLSYAEGIAADSAGNFYFADKVNHRVRKVSAAGIITAVAGSGTPEWGGDGGLATAAQLRYPAAVVLDAPGNLYIADSRNYRVRKVDQAGIITTVAGNGTQGFTGDGGLATDASISEISAIAVDPAGSLYIAAQNRVRKVNASGIITTIAGNGTSGLAGDGGPATSAQLEQITALAIDSAGNLYIADGSRGRRIGSDGIITAIAGAGISGEAPDGTAPEAAQIGAAGLSVAASGNLYIADPWNGLVRKVQLACASEPAAASRDVLSGISVLRGATGAVSSGGGRFSSDPGVAADAGGRLVIAARDMYDSLWATVSDPRSPSWTGWSFGGGSFKGTPAVAAAGGPAAYIAVRDSWNSYWLVNYDPASAFGSWNHLGGVFASDPAIAACPDGTVYIVGKDMWNSLWSERYVPGRGFEPWQWGRGVVDGKPSLACGRNSVVHIAVRDRYNSLWLARVSGSVWQNWSHAGGVMSGDPEIATAGNGTLYVFLRDTGNGVWYRGYDEDGAAWKSWVFTNGTLKDASPAVAQGVLSILGRDAMNNLWRFDAGLGKWFAFGQPATAGGPMQGAPR